MREFQKQLNKWAKIGLFCLFFILIVVLAPKVKAVWNEPSAVPPNDNLYGVLTIGPEDQAKSGALKFGASGTVASGYMLEATSPGAQINDLNITGILSVDPQDPPTNSIFTFLVDPTGSVKIGDFDELNVRLGVQGNISVGYNDGTDNSIPGRAIQGLSSGDYGVYGLGHEAGNSGVYGENTSTDDCNTEGCYGVEGSGVEATGIKGESAEGIGVVGESLETGTDDYGIYAENLNPAGKWAGYFEGKVQSTDEVVGTKFLPTKLRNSLIPYTSGQLVERYNYNILPLKITSDANYLYVASNAFVSGETGLAYKIDKNTGRVVKEYTVGYSGSDILYDNVTNPSNPYVWLAVGNKWNGRTLFRINTVTDKVEEFPPEGQPAFSCPATRIALDTSGLYIWLVSAGGENCGGLPFNDKLYKINTTSGSIEASFQFCNEAACSSVFRNEPSSIIYDNASSGGPYLWVTFWNSNKVYKISVSNPGGGDGDIIQSDVTAIVDIDGPTDLVLDNVTSGRPFIWVSANPDGSTNDGMYQIKANTGAVLGFQGTPTGGENGPTSITFDGTYVWVGTYDWPNGIASRFLASNPGAPPDNFSTSFGATYNDIYYDGTNIWTVHYFDNGIAKLNTDGSVAANFSYTLHATQNSTFDSTNLWSVGNGYISKVRISDGFKIFDKEIGIESSDAVFDGNYVWVTDRGENRIRKIDPNNGDIICNIPTPPVVLSAQPVSAVFDGTNIWVSSYLENVVTEISVSNCSLLNQYSNFGGIPATPGFGKIIFDGDSDSDSFLSADRPYTWVIYNDNNDELDNDALIRIDEYGNSTTYQGLIYDQPFDILFDGSSYWVTSVDAEVAGDTNYLTKFYFQGTCDKETSRCKNDETVICQESGVYRDDKCPPVIIDYQLEEAGPSYIAFDGTYIWLANIGDDSLTRVIAADPLERETYPLGFKPNGLTFDGTYLWIGDENGLSKYYSGTGWGGTDLSTALTLQDNNPLISQPGNFDISGSGNLTGNIGVGGDLSVLNNQWGGTSDEVITVSPNQTAECSDGYFIKNISSTSLPYVMTGDDQSDVPRDIAVDSTYMYLVGSTPDLDWRIEKRRLSNGQLNTDFGDDGIVIGSTASQYALSIVIGTNYMYVVGSDDNNDWRIEKRRFSDGSLVSSFGTGGPDGDGVITSDGSSFEAYDVVLDRYAGYMYVVGDDEVGGAHNWRIEKRRFSDGALDTNFDSDGIIVENITGQWDAAKAVDFSYDGYIYVVGVDGNFNWRIEKRRGSDGTLVNSFDGDGIVTGDSASKYARGIALHPFYMYVVGNDDNSNWRIEKRQVSNGALCTAANCGTEFGAGGVVTGDSASRFAFDIVTDSDYLYVVGGDDSSNWRIEKRLVTSGAPDTNFDSDGIVSGENLTNIAYSIAMDYYANYMYVFGDNQDLHWRIERRQLDNGVLDTIEAITEIQCRPL